MRARLWICLHLCACARPPGTLLEETAEELAPMLRERGHWVDATLGDGAVRYLGFVATPWPASPGDDLRVTHYWQALRPVTEDYLVFVHVQAQGALGWVPHGDHRPHPETSWWPVGKVVRDEHTLRLGPKVPAEALDLRVGLYRGEERMPVDVRSQHDGSDRLLAGAVPIRGTPVPLPRYVAPRLAAPPVLDGVIEEAEWSAAPWTEAFVLSRGDAPSTLHTRARVAWDEAYLYLAFEADDPDLQGTHAQRDAPIYQEEALEVFLSPTGDMKSYIELQVSPRGTLFDASFHGGPRRNMDRAYEARFEVGVALRGTLNDPSDHDMGWTTEWRVLLSSVRGATMPVQPGTEWRMNLFRVAKDRVHGRVTRDESAWSPPLMGDFHNLERFGTLVFGDAQP